MVGNPLFGECLYRMLSAIDIRYSSLAKFLNVDSSLVNRWIHGKRTPPYRSSYIEKISEFIAGSILNSLQEERLHKLLDSMDGSLYPGTDLREKLKRVLLEAQGRSIELEKDKKQKVKNIARINSPPVSGGFIQTACRDSEKEGAAAGGDAARLDGTPGGNIPRHCTVPLSKQDRIITGARNIISAIMELLENALKAGGGANKTIVYISFNNDIDMLCDDFDLQLQMEKTLQGLLSDGWTIIFLLRLNNDSSRTVRILAFLASLLSAGNFYIYYLKKHDVLTAGRELIIVPGVGALSCYPTRLMSRADFAFYFRTPAAEEALLKYFNDVVLAYAQPLIREFTLNVLNEFRKEPLEAEKVYGRRFLCKDGPGILTLPLELYKRYLARNGVEANALRDRLERHERRLRIFSSNIAYHKCRDIYTIESMHRFIYEARYPDDSFYGVENFKAGEEDVIEHLNHIVELLKRHDNYEIALVGDKHILGRAGMYCVIKEKHSVELEIWNGGNKNRIKYFSLKEPMAVKAFEEHFTGLWDSIAPINREKREIINWFEGKIKILLQRKNHIV